MRACPLPWSNQKLYSPGRRESTVALRTTVDASSSKDSTRVSWLRFFGGITTVRATRVVTAPAKSAAAVATLPRATATVARARALRPTVSPPIVGDHGIKSAVGRPVLPTLLPTAGQGSDPPRRKADITRAWGLVSMPMAAPRQTTPPPEFASALESIERARVRKDVVIESIPAPKGLAPWSVALSA